MLRAIVFAALGLAMATPATAAPVAVNFGPEASVQAGFAGNGVLSIDVVVPTNATALLAFDLTTEGDFNTPDEFLSVSFDGVSLGDILNNNTGDDDFNFSGGTDIGSIDVRSGSLDAVVAAGLTLDGLITLVFTGSAEANAPQAVNTESEFPGLTGQFAVKGTLTFDVPDAAVPLPPALPLLAAGVAIFGFAGQRRRKS